MAKIYLGKENTARTISNLISGTKSLLSKIHICREDTLTDIKTAIGNDTDTANASGSVFSRLNYISENINSGGSNTLRSPKSIHVLVNKDQSVRGKGKFFGTGLGRRLDGGFTVDGQRIYITNSNADYESNYMYIEGEFNNEISLNYTLNTSNSYGSVVAIVYEEA